MCGRFVGFRMLAELQSHFPIDVADVESAGKAVIGDHPLDGQRSANVRGWIAIG